MSDLNLESMGAEKQDYVFRPVECTESAIASHDPIKGFVYFATDSQKIYYGDENEYIPMGGNSGIYYSNKTFSDTDIQYPTLSVEDFESGELPRVDDLVINVGGNELYNGFYKVVDVLSETEVSVQYLPVGGGGTGGSGGGNSGGSAWIDYIFPEAAQDTVLAKETYIIEYKLSAEDAAGDPVINSGTARWYVNKKMVKEEIVYPGNNSFNVTNYLDPSLTTGNEVTVAVSIDTGGTINSSARKQWNIHAIDLSLTLGTDFNSNPLVDTDTFTIEWTPYGGVDCTTHIVFDGDYQNGYYTFNHKASETNKPKNESFISLDYGVHEFEIQLSAKINGVEYRTESIYNKITFISGGTAPLITVPFYQTHATQYDTIIIPFVAYDPNKNPTFVQFYVNGNQISNQEYDRTLHNWAYTIDTYGNLELALKCGDSTETFTLIVEELNLDVNEASGAKFKLKASAFSGNDELQAWSQNGVGLDFSDNFDWKNGGIQIEKDEKGNQRKYICVKNNTTMTIDYNLFGSFNRSAGKEFKIIFKATNCYDYDAEVLTCHDGNIGLKLNAQNAVLNIGGEQLITQYCEDSYIELETEIWREVQDSGTEAKPVPGDRFIMFWVDGVPANVKPYSYGATFTQNNPTKITIGSPDCDVYVYLVKVYEKYLVTEDHISNFIMDAPNVEEMLARYHRNNILDNRGNISYQRLIEQNPGCSAHLYDIERMTRNKKDKVKGCHYEQYLSNPNKADYLADDVTIKVQGTSSAAYGVAAFNIDTEFESGMTDGDGNIIKHYDENNNELIEYRGFWDMSGNSIPIDFTCTKVNVASCENANNALNADWYNKYQPYHDAHRRKNPKARDCMEFIPGVMFVKDRNNVPVGQVIIDPETGEAINPHSSNAYANVFGDDTWYMGQNPDNRPYLQYAICNMGNSKDNIHVFHDTTNPMACCVEVLDNQNVEHWMTVKADKTAFEETDTKDAYYEFRYPEDPMAGESEDAFKARLEILKGKWLEFENWMASCDPRPYDAALHPYGYTGEELPSPVTFGSKTFLGFDPPGFENTESPTGVSLKGTTITKYAGTYTHDTKEYRIAKMLKECEDHMVMDSVVYHYLFIERHTMVDNVAKNTFWSTEDGVHWDLTKNYDNDTADGNNNTGYLVYSYGIECMDKESDTKYVFNAIDSVWINFIHELYDARKALFAQLDSGVKGTTTSAWSASAYLNRFKNFQNIIPERCWIEDYFRKYIRPRRLGLDTDTYLKRLEGGKKTHQRAQYETYHEYYTASEYDFGIAQSQGEALDIRCQSGATFSEDTVLPITTYIDCYPRIYIGGRTGKSETRVLKGQTYNLPIGKLISAANDSTAYIYPSPMIQTLEKIYDLYPQYVTLGKAKKLRSIEIGSDAPGYYNANLSSADISLNTMLESAFIQNSGKIGEGEDSLKALELKNLKNLKELRINGSKFPGITFADGGLLETAYINGVKDLKASNLNNLKEIVFDLNIYDNLRTISVINCDGIDTYDLVKNSKGLTNYCLNGINWTITNNTLLNGALVNIDILDKLLSIRPLEGMTTITALTGKITIDQSCSADEFDIYKKYCKQYPNLEIAYTNKVSLDTAVKIEFKSDKGDNAETHYKVLASGNPGDLTIGQLTNVTSNEGPTEAKLTQPTKVPTQALQFKFSGYWYEVLEDGLKQYYYDDTISAEDAKEGSISLMDLIPEKDYIFIPDFIDSPQIYTVYFIVDDETVGEFKVEYNTKYQGDIKNYWYKDESKLPEDQRYRFLGWSKIPNKNKAEYVDAFDLTVTGNLRLYGLFEQESVYTSATSEEYFKQANFDFGYKNTGNHSISIPNKTYTAITIRNEYKGKLQGKITLPSTYNGKIVTGIGIGGLSNEDLITHIYFLEDSQCEAIGKLAFSGCENLKIVQLPETVKIIGEQAFKEDLSLERVNLNDNIIYIGAQAFAGDMVNVNYAKIKINKLPESLMILGTSAFHYAGPNIDISYFPESLVDLGSLAFAGCENVAISYFGSSNKDGKNYLTYIPNNCFLGAGKNKMNSITEIVFEDSIISIGTNSFMDSYGSEKNENLIKISCKNPLAKAFYDAGQTGLKMTVSDEGYN